MGQRCAALETFSREGAWQSPTKHKYLTALVGEFAATGMVALSATDAAAPVLRRGVRSEGERRSVMPNGISLSDVYHIIRSVNTRRSVAIEIRNHLDIAFTLAGQNNQHGR